MEKVIVRDSRNRPLRRLVVSVEGRTVYIVAPEALDRVKAGLSAAIGFDKNDVFTDTYGDTEPLPGWHDLRRYGM